jgi:hypothetical protein
MKRKSDKSQPHPERDKQQGNPRGRGVRPADPPETARANARARNDGGVLKRKAQPRGARSVGNRKAAGTGGSSLKGARRSGS